MSDYKIKIGMELNNDLKEQIDKYIHDTAFRMGLDFKLEKMSLREDDTLIIRIPTDEYGDILIDCETAQEYYNAVKDNVICKNVIAIPDVLTFEALDDEYLELLVKGLNEELSKRNKINFTFNDTGEDFVIKLDGDYYNTYEENEEDTLECKINKLEKLISALDCKINELIK